MQLLALTNEEIVSLASAPVVIAAVEAAARAAETDAVAAPQRAHLKWQDGTFLVMPAISAGMFGVKLVAIVSSNEARALPTLQGIMTLMDAQTGLPLALLNAAALTAQRTGAVGALGIRYTTPPDVSSIGLVGCGTQSIWQAIYACAVRPITAIFCVSRSPLRRANFTAAVKRYVPGVRITFCTDAEDLLRCTETIIAATTSAQPVLPNDPERLHGKHFISIGSFKPTMQELPDEVYRLAGGLIIDSQAARHEVGDVINPVARGILSPHSVMTLGALIKDASGIDIQRTTVFKSVGMALYDLYVAHAIYQDALHRKVGRMIQL